MDNLFFSVFEHSPDLAIVVDSDRSVLYSNRAANEAFDAIRVGSDLALTVRHPDILNAVDKTISKGTKEVGEFSIPGPLAQVFELHTIALPIDGADETDRHCVLVSMHDKTKAARSEEMRADFIANASHELRSPLSSILGFIETLQGPASEDPKARVRFLGIMQREAERMNRLIDDLLRLSRVEIDEHVRPRGTVNVLGCIRNVFDLLQPRAQSKDMRLELVSDSDSANVSGDTDQLVQVFRNLVENAIHYGDQGTSVIVTIEQRHNRPNEPRNGVAVHVQDHGKGIKKEHIPRLTERFYRVDNARTRHNSDIPISTGLGLAIVKHIVNRHRGRLKITSEEGKGSTFSIFLPSE